MCVDPFCVELSLLVVKNRITLDISLCVLHWSSAHVFNIRTDNVAAISWCLPHCTIELDFGVQGLTGLLFDAVFNRYFMVV